MSPSSHRSVGGHRRVIDRCTIIAVTTQPASPPRCTITPGAADHLDWTRPHMTDGQGLCRPGEWSSSGPGRIGETVRMSMCATAFRGCATILLPCETRCRTVHSNDHHAAPTLGVVHDAGRPSTLKHWCTSSVASTTPSKDGVLPHPKHRDHPATGIIPSEQGLPRRQQPSRWPSGSRPRLLFVSGARINAGITWGRLESLAWRIAQNLAGCGANWINSLPHRLPRLAARSCGVHKIDRFWLSFRRRSTASTICNATMRWPSK